MSTMGPERSLSRKACGWSTALEQKGQRVAHMARMERTYSAKTLAVVSPMFEGAIRNGPLRSYAKS